jgi:D-xylulose reductase
MVLGHESSGIIHSTGSAVSTLKVGDQVAMEPGIPCRRCVRCKEGRYNLCPDMAFAATPPYDGTLARYYRLPEDFCVKLDKGMSMEEGALVEPSAVAVHVCRQAGVKPGDSVLVFGAGPVGLLVCAVSRAFGAKKVISVDINEERLAFAKEYAATHVFRSQKESAEDSAKRLVEECELESGADVVIDASGAAICIQTGIHALRNGGTYLQAGMVRSTTCLGAHTILYLQSTRERRRSHSQSWPCARKNSTLKDRSAMDRATTSSLLISYPPVASKSRS